MFTHLLLGVALTLCILSSASSSPADVQGTLHRRNYFYVGGSYSPQGDSTIISEQIYVEHLVPANITEPFPLLFLHGDGMTGTNFLNTPDGRLGWADYFLSRGYELYIIDQPSRGRSAWQQAIDGPQSSFDTFTIESHFTATEKFKLWPQAALHTQWPGTGLAGDPIFDNFYSSNMPRLTSQLEVSQKIKAAGTLLLDKIGPVVLLTHSQAGQFGWILADSRPSHIKTIVSLEPMGPPFQDAVFDTAAARPFGLTEIPLAYSPPIDSATDLHPIAISTDPAHNFTCFQQSTPARKLTNLANIPVIVVTSESSYHAVYDPCSVSYLRQAGVSVEYVKLAEVGIKGNGHMMFMEKNGLQIAEQVVQKWILEQKRLQNWELTSS